MAKQLVAADHAYHRKSWVAYPLDFYQRQVEIAYLAQNPEQSCLVGQVAAQQSASHVAALPSPQTIVTSGSLESHLP